MDQRARDVLRMGDRLFSNRKQIDSLWQEIALNFFPERGDFTYNRVEGEEFADHLFSSYPVMARRELGNLLSANLRPRSQKWFSVHVDDDDIDEGDAERKYLEHLTDIQWRATYDRPAQFVRATKEADHDFAAFGNAVIQVSLNVNGDGLLFRSHHLRDCAWSENAEGKIDVNHRNWKPTARQLKHHFPDTISKDVRKACEKDPEKPFECRHAILPSRLYHYKSKSGREFPFVSLYVEKESETVLEEVGINHFEYVIPRWQTVSGSAYGVSMATMILLPDGRTLQVVMRTLREAGENYVNPPMIAVDDVVRGDIALYPGGITTVDREYDEKLGEALRPITKDRGGFPIGEAIAEALRMDIRAGFFLDKIQLPEMGKPMTAFEVRRRLEEHIRSSSPIFEPVIEQYNDPLCDTVFQILTDNGAFPLEQMPESLENRDIKFKFRSPLADLADQAEAAAYVETRDSILMPAVQVDPAQAENVDFTRATRDAMRASGWKAKWFKPEGAVDQAKAQMQEQAEAQQTVQEIAEAGAVAEQAGKGIDAVVNAGARPNGAAAAGR